MIKKIRDKVEIVTYSFAEELTNALTHWLGFGLGILGLVLLLVRSVKIKSAISTTAFAIYGACLIFLYFSSAIYHSVPWQKIKKILRVMDHSSIFIFIAGTYTPIILLSLRGAFRIVMLVFIWLMALLGVLFKILTYGKFGKYNKLSLALYLIMGWISVMLFRPMYRTAGIKLIIFLSLGGLFYSIGSFFYANKKIPFNHAIWHIFVIVASVMQYLGIFTSYAAI